MIPLKLQIKNFLSYGSTPQTINFTNHQLICLSGKNGHGKSALLDAITWCLWGQARKIGATAKPDQGLLRLGTTEMTVSFDFLFDQQTYRVRRDFSKKYGKPHSHIEFGLLQDNDYFVSLTEKTIRKTQTKIEHTIGLDFDTFINSSFLRQGGANEFSKKSAKERKEILATILGLHHYDKAKQTVLEKIKEITKEKDHCEKLYEHNQEEYKKLEYIEKATEETLGAIARIEQHIKTTQEEQVLQQTQALQLQREQETHKQVTQAIKENETHEQRQRTQLTNLVSDWKQTHTLLLSLPNQEYLKKQKQKLEKEAQSLHKNLQESLRIKEQLLQKKEEKAQVEQEQNKQHYEVLEKEKLHLERLTTELAALTATEKTIATKITSLTSSQKELENNIQTLHKVLPPDYLISDYQEQSCIFEKRKNRYQKWIEQGNWINKEINDLQRKQELSQDVNNPSCPLCEQNLSQARKRFLHKKFGSQTLFLMHRFKRIKKAIEQIKITLKKQHDDLERMKSVEQFKQEITKLEDTKKAYETEQTAITNTKQTVDANIDKAKKQLETSTAQQQKLHENNTEWKKLTANIQDLEKKLLKITVDQKKQANLNTQIADIEAQLSQCDQIPHYKITQAERQVKVHQMCTELKSITKQQESLKHNLQASINTLQKHKHQATLQDDLQKKLIENQKKHAQLLEKKGELATLTHRKKELEKSEKKYTEQRTKLITELQDLHISAHALGKDGIQALLIEDAIPEIEQEANELLAQLTDNQASISIESLRDLKKGGTRETLDINISDAQGIRPYELFSGGEAFRIDFSLRIAISKLLARRAGTSLQTLIIDEGFGSQDDEGLQRIMDALYAIQDDFKKIVIVSHLPTMKEQFPVHFYIQKEPEGSKVTVIEHG